MDYFQMIFSLLFVAFQGALETAVLGADLSTEAAIGVELHHPPAPWRPRRSKRCSCSSLLDKECVYFCHLDIIWINTPEHTVPYGLGGPSRSKRALQDSFPLKQSDGNNRCQCANQRDKKCRDFCQTGKEVWAQNTLEQGRNQLKKGEQCTDLGLKCMYWQLVNRRKMRRLEAIGNRIKAAFNVAKLKAELHMAKAVTHNRAHEKRNIWESLKTTS